MRRRKKRLYTDIYHDFNCRQKCLYGEIPLAIMYKSFEQCLNRLLLLAYCPSSAYVDSFVFMFRMEVFVLKSTCFIYTASL